VYNDKFVYTHEHSVMPGIPFHVDIETVPDSNAWAIDALGQGLAPVIVNMLYIDIDEFPPQYVLDSLDRVAVATNDNSYWSLVKEVFNMFYEIFTDDRLVELEMVQNLASCQGVAGDFIKDSTGLTAISTMGRCYEEEMDALDGIYTGQYKPTLPEYNAFWRLIDSEESIMAAMVEDVQHTVPTGWMKDDIMFGWLRRVGSNPDMLRLAKSSDIGANFPVTDAMYNQAMDQSGAGTLDAAMADGRLFIMDFALFGDGVINNNGKTLFAPKALFAVPISQAYGTDGLRTVAIQQFQKPSTDYPIMGAPKPNRRIWTDASLTVSEKEELVKWVMFKTSVQVAESSYFEVVTHFGKTHMVLEPFLMATDNACHPTHPLRKLLMPHFAGTDHINQGAVDSLIAAGGTIDKIFPPPIETVQAIAIVGAREFLQDFNNQFFDTAFRNRGTWIGSKLTEYPFRDDGKMIWDATLKWTTDYLNIAYSSDSAMRADPWLKCWWDMLVSPSYGMLKNAGDVGNGALYTRGYLAKVLALIIWTGSGQHAATNFPQKDVGAHVTMNPTAAWSEGKTATIDCSASSGASSATDATNAVACFQPWFDMLPPLHEALDQLNTEYLLGSVHYNRLGRYEEDVSEGHFAGAYRTKELEFQSALAASDVEINGRNTVAGTMREHFNYIIMKSANIPNSINI
jgi:arachidonate 15-lipoxygenase